MRRIKTYAFALILCITSLGALSSNNIYDDQFINLRHYSNLALSAAERASQAVSASIESAFPTAQEGSRHSRASSSVQDDSNIAGTLIVVLLIAGFSIARRLD